MEKFKCILSLRHPSPVADIRDRKEDIETVVEQFNRYYDESCRLKAKIIGIRKHEIHLLVSDKHGHPPIGKDFLLISKRLYHKFGWKDLSTKESKLFIVEVLDLNEDIEEVPTTPFTVEKHEAKTEDIRFQLIELRNQVDKLIAALA